MNAKPDFWALAEKIGREAASPEQRPDIRVAIASCVTTSVWGALESVWDQAVASVWAGADSSPPARACACGCGRPVAGHRADARYATGACRVRVHRASRLR